MNIDLFISITLNVCLASAVAYLANQLRVVIDQKHNEEARLRRAVSMAMRAYEDLDRGFADYRKAAAHAAFAQRTASYMEPSEN